MMRKIMFAGFIVSMLSLLSVGVFALGAQENTTETIEKSWTLTSTEIDEIYVVGTNQPVNLVLERTENAETIVTVTGKVPKRSLESLANTEFTKQDEKSLRLFFVKPNITFGNGHVEINPGAREAVTITVSLGKDTILKNLELDSSGGQVHLTLPDDFEAIYDLKAIEAEVINAPQSQAGAETTIKVENYFDNLIVD